MGIGPCEPLSACPAVVWLDGWASLLDSMVVVQIMGLR